MKECVICAMPFTQAATGRPRLYCSTKCKGKAPGARAKDLVRGARYRDREDRREEARKRTAEWRASNPERARQADRANYERFRTERIAAARAYREANREKTRAAARAYAQAHPDVVWRSDANRRAREKAAFVEAVDRAVLYERDGGVCGICRRPVSRPESSVDHIIPLSKGGEHSYANTRIAHLRCNIARGNRGAAQIRMLA